MFTQQLQPGFQVGIESDEVAPFRGGRNGETQITQVPYTISSGATDAGNTPTTTLRGGNIMQLNSPLTELLPYTTASAMAGARILGVLPRHTNMLDMNVATKRVTGLFTSGLLRASEIPNLDRYAAGVLVNQGFRFDDPSYNLPLFSINRMVTATVPATLTAADHGTRFLTATDSVTFTLPTIAAGLYFEFQASSASVTIISPVADLLICTASTSLGASTSHATSVVGTDVLMRVWCPPAATLLWHTSVQALATLAT